VSVKSEMNNGYFTCRLQVGRSRVLFPMMSLEVFIDIILPGRTMVLGLTQPLTEMRTRNVSLGGGANAAGA